jgi:peptidoglycan hydrolase-like protein with peptidoglycan-binding domain
MKPVRAVIVLAVLLGAPAQAATAGITLAPDRAIVPYGGTVKLVGGVDPPVAGQAVELLVQTEAGLAPAGAAPTAADGTFSFSLPVSAPAAFVARSAGVDSAPVVVGVRPLLRVRLSGSRSLGGRLVLSGRLLPAPAGALTLSVGATSSPLAVDGAGRFHARVPTDRIDSYTAVVQLAPAPNFEAVQAAVRYRIQLPTLRLGSHGAPVRNLEWRLAELHYVLRGVNGYFGYDTYEAVLAFQKVHRVSRTGRVTAATWRLLSRAGVPRARIPRGDHMEVDKSRQVLFEVRKGKVVRVVHVSTGATGNTPVGRWRVYSKTPGYNGSRMYYSLFFLRGFAIHGYASVPPFPASHGCVRTPIWFAPGLYSRWKRGAAIWVFP